jgi:ArsR family transcriptional regulator
MRRLADIFKLLSDETRLRIVILLAQDQLCVCQIQGILNLSQPKVSRNLAKLRDMQLVSEERKEKYVYYRLQAGDAVLTGLITYIIRTLEQYPQLKSDQINIKDKEKYLKQCSGSSLNAEAYESLDNIR